MADYDRFWSMRYINLPLFIGHGLPGGCTRFSLRALQSTDRLPTAFTFVRPVTYVPYGYLYNPPAGDKFKDRLGKPAGVSNGLRRFGTPLIVSGRLLLSYAAYNGFLMGFLFFSIPSD